MVRYEGWEKRFSDYLMESQSKGFQWGVFDCVLFAVKAVEVITGVNVYGEYLGYKSQSGADKIIKKNGSLESLISKHFGDGHDYILRAKRGDLALVRIPYRAIGVVDDSGQFVAVMSDKGYARIPLSKAKRIWSYG